jgi:hypothetical protein
MLLRKYCTVDRYGSTAIHSRGLCSCKSTSASLSRFDKQIITKARNGLTVLCQAPPTKITTTSYVTCTLLQSTDLLTNEIVDEAVGVQDQEFGTRHRTDICGGTYLTIEHYSAVF